MGVAVRTAFPEIEAFSQRNPSQPFASGISIVLSLSSQGRLRVFWCGPWHVDPRLYSGLQLDLGVRDGDDHPVLEMNEMPAIGSHCRFLLELR